MLLFHGPAITEDYIAKRAADRSHRFRWPQRDGQSLYGVVQTALSEMTQSHCAYCDGFPLDATGEEQIDHFRPKSRPEFYPLVCQWENLFLICSACNRAKRDQWDEALLRPDEPGLEFSRYFTYRTDTGVLEPNDGASLDDRRRATRTIQVLDLNRAGLCTMRMQVMKWMLREEFDQLPYRYLLSLCG